MVMESSELSRCFRLSFPLPPEKLLPRFLSRFPTRIGVRSCASSDWLSKSANKRVRYVQLLLRVKMQILYKDEKTLQNSGAKVNNGDNTVN